MLAQTGIGNRDNIGSDLVSKSGLGCDLSDLVEFKGDSLLKSGSVDDRLRGTCHDSIMEDVRLVTLIGFRNLYAEEVI